MGGEGGVALAWLRRLRAAQELGSAQDTESPVISSCFTCLTLIKKQNETQTLLHATPKSPCKAQPGSVGRFLSSGPDSVGQGPLD